jgi:hypothetical protein
MACSLSFMSQGPGNNLLVNIMQTFREPAPTLAVFSSFTAMVTPQAQAIVTGGPLTAWLSPGSRTQCFLLAMC